MELPKSKIKPFLKIADDELNLQKLDTNVVVNQLEEQMRLRDESIDKHIQRQLRARRL
jgi:hypothetical protein